MDDLSSIVLFGKISFSCKIGIKAMIQSMPERIKITNFAKKKLLFLGEYQLKDFPRVSTLISNKKDRVWVSLGFDLIKNEIPCIEGHIKFDAVLSCQRCLNKLKTHIKSNFRLAFIEHEQQHNQLDSNFETIFKTKEELSTIEFLTDEMLISMPMIPRHDYKCVSYTNKQRTGINQEKNENPFSILKQLKSSNSGLKE